MSIFDTAASREYDALTEQSINAGSILNEYSLEGSRFEPAFHKNETIREQRISLLSDIYYNALEGARGMDQGEGMSHLEKLFYHVVPQTVFTIRKPASVLKALRTDPRMEKLHADIINKPKGLRENLYSLTHKHLEKNKDKSYAASKPAQTLVEFLKNQCPSIKRQKRMDAFCKNMRHMMSQGDSVTITFMMIHSFDL